MLACTAMRSTVSRCRIGWSCDPWRRQWEFLLYYYPNYSRLLSGAHTHVIVIIIIINAPTNISCNCHEAYYTYIGKYICEISRPPHLSSSFQCFHVILIFRFISRMITQESMISVSRLRNLTLNAQFVFPAIREVIPFIRQSCMFT